MSRICIGPTTLARHIVTNTLYKTKPHHIHAFSQSSSWNGRRRQRSTDAASTRTTAAAHASAGQSGGRPSGHQRRDERVVQRVCQQIQVNQPTIHTRINILRGCVCGHYGSKGFTNTVLCVYIALFLVFFAFI